MNRNRVTRSFYVHRVRENFGQKLEREGFSSDQISSLTQQTDIRFDESGWRLEHPDDPAAKECLRQATREVDERYTL
ncbi:MAG: hypothetical protein V3U43_08995 [Pseudomonadales bacterium]